MNSKASYFYIPKTANVAISDKSVTFRELADIVSELSFDSPDAVVNYKIEVVRGEVSEKSTP